MEANQGTRTLGSTLIDQLIGTRGRRHIAKAHSGLGKALARLGDQLQRHCAARSKLPRQELKDLVPNRSQECATGQSRSINELNRWREPALLARQ